MEVAAAVKKSTFSSSLPDFAYSTKKTLATNCFACGFPIFDQIPVSSFMLSIRSRDKETLFFEGLRLRGLFALRQIFGPKLHESVIGGSLTSKRSLCLSFLIRNRPFFACVTTTTTATVRPIANVGRLSLQQRSGNAKRISRKTNVVLRRKKTRVKWTHCFCGPFL